MGAPLHDLHLAEKRVESLEELEGWLKPVEAAEMIGTTEETVFQLLANGQLPGVNFKYEKNGVVTTFVRVGPGDLTNFFRERGGDVAAMTGRLMKRNQQTLMRKVLRSKSEVILAKGQ